jgi:hypothetical protein
MRSYLYAGAAVARLVLALVVVCLVVVGSVYLVCILTWSAGGGDGGGTLSTGSWRHCIVSVLNVRVLSVTRIVVNL